jgi:hypothetical protein
LLGNEYLLRLRRDGTITLAQPCSGNGHFFPLVVLSGLLELLALAQRTWKHFSMFDPATLVIKFWYQSPLSVKDGLMMPATGRVDVQVDFETLMHNPLSLARDAMDRIYHHIGAAQSPFFDDTGKLRPDVSTDLREVLARVAWRS